MDIILIKRHLEMLNQTCDMDWNIEWDKKNSGYKVKVIVKKYDNKWYSTAFHSYDIIDSHDINHILGQLGKNNK